MEEYQKRMVEEYKELNTKIDKLRAFLATKEDTLSVEQFRLMKSQLYSMLTYSSILLMRLNLENIPFAKNIF